MKIGFDQLNRPAPLIYRRVVNTFIIFIVPSTVTFLDSIVQTEHTKTLIFKFGIYIIGLLKGFEYLLGDNEYTSTTQETAK